MPKEKVCPKCGVSRRFVRQHVWQGSGIIVQSKNPAHRLVFLENENIIAAFKGVEGIINRSIEHIVTEGKRRATYDYIDHLFPEAVKALARRAGIRPVIRNIASLASVFGYGKVELDHVRRVHDQGDYVTLHASELYSIPLFCGDFAGSFNAIDKREVGISYRELGQGEYEITGHITPHPLELQERLQSRSHAIKPGDIEQERCPRCGCPAALSSYVWHFDRGVILNRESGRRMVMVGPAMLDAIIDDLEKELGKTVLEAVIEAQRRFTRTGFYSPQQDWSEEDLRLALALRGLGNLREITRDETSLLLRLENPCLYPIIVGLMLGTFELLTGREAEVDWKVSEDDTLIVEVTTCS